MIKYLLIAFIFLTAYSSVAQPCEFYFHLNGISPSEGIIDTLEVSVSNFQNIESFQGGLRFDSTFFEFVGYEFSEEITSENTYGLASSGNGFLSFLWVGQSTTLSNNSVVFEVYLKGLKDDVSSCNFEFTDIGNITIEVIGQNSIPLAVCTDCSGAELSNLNDTYLTFNSIDIYPNPSYGKINIESQNEFESISIYTITGRKIRTFDFNTQLDLAYLDEGMYFLEFVNNGQSESIKRIIIEK